MRCVWLAFLSYISGVDLAQIRRIVIVAMFSDDELFKQLTLKGGNALNLVYQLGSRVSADIDLSLEEDFRDLEDAKRRIFAALENRFNEARLKVFDQKLTVRPPSAGDPRFGGYEVTFKLMEPERYSAIGDHSKRQRESIVIGPVEQRTFRVQISKHEYCAGRREADFDDYTINVYTPEMIVIEKLRAICQQMPAYARRGHSTPRARDFYDIHSVITAVKIDLGTAANLQLTRDIFAAKEVPLNFIPKIEDFREFHRQDWPAVELAVAGKIEGYDFYFDFVTEQIGSLEPFWKEHPP